ncbi:MAG: ferrous iron transport protein A, partial [Lachnospiraceae bacterium]|nr:ferrous iron transport protein A [Lachnospiraceae bacterium]
MTLKDLKPGKSAVVTEVGGEGALRQHFLDMGIIPGVEITVVKYAPMGDPVELMIHGYELTLRLDDAGQILVKECDKKENQDDKEYAKVRREHPGFGEGGRYHSKEEENPVPEGTVL